MLKKVFKRFAALACVMLFLYGSLPVLSISSGAAERDDFYYHADGYAYKELTLTELIEQVVGEKPTEAEERYLLLGGQSFRYTDRVPTSSVSTEYGEGILTVTAQPYGYTAVNGEKLTWIPKTAHLSDGESVPFTVQNGRYTAKIADADLSKELLLTVEYDMTVNIEASLWAELANRAYLAGTAAVAEKQAYQEKYQAYQDAVARYNAYLKEMDAYRDADAAFQKCQAELEKYRAELEEYTAYCAKKTAYEQAQAARQQYLADQAAYDDAVAAYEIYTDEKQKYDTLYVEYQKYLTVCSAAREKLSVINAIYITDSAGHQMYATLMGDTVSTVVEKKDLLVNPGGCDPNDIDNAGDSTIVLKELLSGYKELTADRDRLAYYQAHYTEIRDQFIRLYSSLNSLYRNGNVRMKLKDEGRLERYQNFIAHLYVISTALDDQAIVDYSWKVYKTDKTLEKVLVAEQFIDDRNAADPSGVAYPEQDQEEPTAPTPVSLPGNKPAFVPEPTKTWVEDLIEPIEPAEVPKPTEPQKVSEPTDPPQEPIFTGEVKAVAEAVEAGTIKERITNGQAKMVLETAVDIPLFPSDYPAAAFYDWDGTLLKTVIVESGDTAEYGKAPKRASTAKYSYTFSGWYTHDGKAADLTNLTENIAVYAQYREQLNSYTVKWTVEGNTTLVTVPYGEIPVPPMTPTKDSDERYHYRFSGWSVPIVMVTGNAEYTACFEKTARIYTVVFLYRDQRAEYRLGYGEMPTVPSPLPEYSENGLRYFFNGWDKEPASVTGDAEYTAVYTTPDTDLTIEERPNSYRVTLAVEQDLSAIVALALEKTKGLELKMPAGTVSIASDTVTAFAELTKLFLKKNETTKTFTLSADAGEQAVTAFPAQVFLQLPYTAEKNCIIEVVYLTEAGEELPIHADFTDEMLSFWASSTGEYRVKEYYKVELCSTGSGLVRFDKDFATAGETVKPVFLPDQGMKLSEITVLSAVTGEVLELKDGAFVMPEGGVQISVTFAPIEYTVRFIVDGKEYAVATYRYGDKVILPQTPTLEAEEGYIYTFSGWSPAVLETVVEDAEYTAQFTKTEVVDPNEIYKSPYNSNKLYEIYLPIAGGVLLCAGCALVAVIVVKKKKRAGIS